MKYKKIADQIDKIDLIRELKQNQNRFILNERHKIIKQSKFLRASNYLISLVPFKSNRKLLFDSLSLYIDSSVFGDTSALEMVRYTTNIECQKLLTEDNLVTSIINSVSGQVTADMSDTMYKLLSILLRLTAKLLSSKYTFHVFLGLSLKFVLKITLFTLNYSTHTTYTNNYYIQDTVNNTSSIERTKAYTRNKRSTNISTSLPPFIHSESEYVNIYSNSKFNDEPIAKIKNLTEFKILSNTNEKTSVYIEWVDQKGVVKRGWVGRSKTNL